MRSSSVVQSRLLVAESDPILILADTVCGLQIQDVFLPLTKTQEEVEQIDHCSQYTIE